MKCGFCSYTDGLCYTSDPPQVKCTIDGEFHKYGADCTAFPSVPIIMIEPTIESECLICGEGVPTGDAYRPAICEKCKAAVMKVREDLERDPCTPILD